MSVTYANETRRWNRETRIHERTNESNYRAWKQARYIDSLRSN